MMRDPNDLRCGEYLGRSPGFVDDGEDAVAIVNGELLVEVLYDTVPDVICEGMA